MFKALEKADTALDTALTIGKQRIRFYSANTVCDTLIYHYRRFQLIPQAED